MSDIPSKLSNSMSLERLSAYTIFNVNMLIFIIICIIYFCIVSSSINSVALSMKPMPCMDNFEQFSGDDNQTSDNYSYKNNVKFESISLTSLDNSILFGQAKRYIYRKNESNNPLYILEVYANLYVLNGNPFGQEKVSDNKAVKQLYNVYLTDTKSNSRMLVDALYKEPDGVYKLKFKSNDVNKFDNYNKIEIVHQYDDKQIPVLIGVFNN